MTSPYFPVFLRVHHLEELQHEQLTPAQRAMWIRWIRAEIAEFRDAQPQHCDERGGLGPDAHAPFLAFLTAKYKGARLNG